MKYILFVNKHKFLDNCRTHVSHAFDACRPTRSFFGAFVRFSVCQSQPHRFNGHQIQFMYSEYILNVVYESYFS